MINSSRVYGSSIGYLDPRSHVTPLVELHGLPECLGKRVRIFVKMAPAGNIKIIPAYYMLKRAETEGKLKEVHTLVEASSGNMASALCMFTHFFGIQNFLAIISPDTAQGKQQELSMLGAQIRFSNTISPKGISAIEYAKKLGDEKGFLNLWQYGNPHNPEAYEKWFAPQIYSQLNDAGLMGNHFVFCAAQGTCGTVTGCGKFFKDNCSDCHIVGVKLLPGEMVPGVRDLARLNEIKINWQNVVDYPVEIGRDEAFLRSIQLSQIGIKAGPSTGLALSGLFKYLQDNPPEKETVAVIPCADSYDLYMEKYGTIVPTAEFGSRLPFGG